MSQAAMTPGCIFLEDLENLSSSGSVNKKIVGVSEPATFRSIALSVPGSGTLQELTQRSSPYGPPIVQRRTP